MSKTSRVAEGVPVMTITSHAFKCLLHIPRLVMSQAVEP